jgi:hypothetical protein
MTPCSKSLNAGRFNFGERQGGRDSNPPAEETELMSRLVRHFLALLTTRSVKGGFWGLCENRTHDTTAYFAHSSP